MTAMTKAEAETRSWLETQILMEHSKAQTMRIVRWVGQDTGRLQFLMQIFLNDPPAQSSDNVYRLTQRSAWAVRYIGEKEPAMMASWLPVLLENLQKPNLHDAIKRNTLNVFEPLDFPPEMDEILADLCFRYLGEVSEAIAIRCASMTILEKICRRIPELSDELRLMLEEELQHGSAGLKSRARKILCLLKK